MIIEFVITDVTGRSTTNYITKMSKMIPQQPTSWMAGRTPARHICGPGFQFSFKLFL